MQQLAELAIELQATRSFDKLLQLVVDCAAELLGTRSAGIRLLAPDSNRLMATRHAGDALALATRPAAVDTSNLDTWVIRHGQVLSETQVGPRAAHNKQDTSDPTSKGAYLGVPILTKGSVLGVVSATHPNSEHFDAGSEQILTVLTAIAAQHVRSAMRDMAIRDPLTGLYNHAHFQRTLDQELEKSASNALPFSLVLVDIDDFRPLNDARGHRIGDALLVALAELVLGKSALEGGFRLRTNDQVARYGPDSLALVLPHTPKEGALLKAEALREQIQDHDFGYLDALDMTVSLGVASVPEDAASRAELIASAEQAVRTAKRCGKNTTVGYSRSLEVANARENASSIDFRRVVALERVIEQKLFSFVYQPIVESQSHRPIAYEALCRPHAKEFNGPGALFETAEYIARIQELGRACRTISTEPLHQLPPDNLLFVNLHPRELDRSLLHEAALQPWASRIVLEITETGAIDDYEGARELIAELRSEGFRIALDDLGAGYAGLNSLAQLQPDFVKLDMALIRRIHEKGSTRRLVKHILEYCAAEKIPVISEGVESAEEHDMVQRIGCPYMQGDFIASPGPAFPEVKAGEPAESRTSQSGPTG